MSNLDEYYYWQKWGKKYDPHKYDYLHAEGPNGGEFEGWKYREECTCDACWLVNQCNPDTRPWFLHHFFREEYKQLHRVREQFPDLDCEAAFNLMKADEDGCIF